MLVFFVHYSKQFAHPAVIEPVVKEWWIGVDLFFVLSGFLIASAIFRELKRTQAFSFKRFYIKRTFRIFPPFFFMLGLYAFLPAEALGSLIRGSGQDKKIPPKPIQSAFFLSLV